MPDPIDVTAMTRELSVRRASHPDASLTEIEAEVDRALVAFRNQTAGTLAHADPTAGPLLWPTCKLDGAVLGGCLATWFQRLSAPEDAQALQGEWPLRGRPSVGDSSLRMTVRSMF